jgi:NAD+ synthase (glutamine-hydrolysing)
MSGLRVRRSRHKRPGARALVVINGSPYHTQQQALRVEQLRTRAAETGLPFIYVNRVGGQDELVFDGASFVMAASGEVVQQMPAWHEALSIATLDNGVPKPVRGSLDVRLEYHVYQALVMGVRDYVGKNRFPGVLLGLLGGRRLGARPRGRRRCAGTRARSCGDDAVGVYALDQPR